MKSNVAVGIIKPSSGNGTSIVPYLDLPLTNKGTNNCVPNLGTGLETGDVVTGWKDANTYWVAAIYNGGDPADRDNYTPLHEIIMDYVCPVPSTTPPSGGSGTPPSNSEIFWMSAGTPLSNCAGQGIAIFDNQFVYVAELPVIVGTILYRYANLTGLYPGNDLWFSTSPTRSYRVNSVGVVTAIDNSCETAPTLLNYEVDNRNVFDIYVDYIDQYGSPQSNLQRGDSIETYTAIEGSLSTQNDGVSINIVP